MFSGGLVVEWRWRLDVLACLALRARPGNCLALPHFPPSCTGLPNVSQMGHICSHLHLCLCILNVRVFKGCVHRCRTRLNCAGAGVSVKSVKSVKCIDEILSAEMKQLKATGSMMSSEVNIWASYINLYIEPILSHVARSKQIQSLSSPESAAALAFRATW